MEASTGSDTRHPFTSLILLLLFTAVCYVVFGFISVFLAVSVYGGNIFSVSLETLSPGAIRMIQGTVTAGIFVVPPLILIFSEKRYHFHYLGTRSAIPVQLIILTACIMFVFFPVREWTGRINQMMHLPDSFKWLENWMREKEDAMEEVTRKLLLMRSIPDLLVNLLVIAILPAIGEELFFRGGLLNIFSRWAGNYHLGIWISAMLFSAIHFQFFGFIPRMLLGVLFGYLFVWSGNIFFPVLGHFINNGTIVIAAWFLQKSGRSLDNLDKVQSTSWYAVALSVVFIIILLRAFYAFTQRTKSEDHENRQ